jgi:hypothetical protein
MVMVEMTAPSAGPAEIGIAIQADTWMTAGDRTSSASHFGGAGDRWSSDAASDGQVSGRQRLRHQRCREVELVDAPLDDELG